MSGLTIELVALDSLRLTEENSAELAERLADEIGMTGVWTHPVVVDRESRGVMDGHHRVAAAKCLGLRLIPTISVSYDDNFVHVKGWSPGEEYSAAEIRRLVKSGRVLPMKTTRHVFDLPLPECRVPLGLLDDASATGREIDPATAHPSRIQILAPYCHALGRRLPVRTLSASALDVETPETIVPHPQMRQQMMRDPGLAALIAAAPCRIALGRGEDGPFRLEHGDLLLLPPALLANDTALSAVTRWGIEAAFIRAAYPFDRTRLPGLLRHGAGLLHALPVDARAQVKAFVPTRIAAELLGSDLLTPSNQLIQWLGILLELDVVDADVAASPALDLELPIERVLVSNGDSRLSVDPTSGQNKYGTVPRPRPEAVHFSSSTASSISDYGFLYADVLRRDLLAHLHETNDGALDLHARLSDAIICELADLVGLAADEIDGAAGLARRADRRRVAAAAPRTWHPLKRCRIGRRTPAGSSRSTRKGHRVLAHKCIGSKTGLSAPRGSTIQTLFDEAPERLCSRFRLFRCSAEKTPERQSR